MKPKVPKHCPGCGENARTGDRILCGACWARTPKGMKAHFTGARDHGLKVAAVKEILNWHHRERTEPKLF